MRFALVLALIVTALTAPAALAGDRAAAPLPDRAFSGPDLSAVRVVCVAETTGHAHAQQLRDALEAAGVPVVD